jgi:hypothetical protein
MPVEIVIDLAGTVFRKGGELLTWHILEVVEHDFPDGSCIAVWLR